MSARPNFIFFITDQQRAQDLGCYGHKLLRTPNIDSIAARGTCFDRFYVASPICMPNRSTLMTGRMPSLHGVRRNGIPLALDAVTFPELLGAAGYQTALVGKSHLQNFTGKPPPPLEPARPGHVPPPRALAEARRDSLVGPYEQENPNRWRDDPAAEMELPFYGFGSVDLAIEHGDTVGGHYARWLRSRNPRGDELRGEKNSAPAPGYTLAQAWRTRLPEELYPTSFVADRAVERMREFARDPARPFFLYCSFPDPHHPFTPPGRYWNLFDPASVTLPASWRQKEEDVPPHARWLRDQRDAGQAVKHTPAQYACNEREAREAAALSFGMITMIDDAIGRVLSELSRLGLSGNTVVVFTTDHGDYLGEHQLMLKGPIHYDSIVHCPFIWADPALPQVAGSRRAPLAGTLDIARTILDRAGVAPFNGMQGVSLLPAIRAESAVTHESVVIEQEAQRAGLGFSTPVCVRTLVTERHRLSLYDAASWGELYDFAEDPHEMKNLWDDAGRSRLRSQLLERLARDMLAMEDKSPAPTNQA
jgi:arylsulfatase A-like enzyme